MPLDICPTGRCAASASPTSSSSSARSAAPAGGLGEPLVQREHLVGGLPVGEAEQLGEVAERALRGERAGRRARDLGAPRRSGARARTRSSPASTCPRRWGRAGRTARPRRPRARRRGAPRCARSVLRRSVTASAGGTARSSSIPRDGDTGLHGISSASALGRHDACGSSTRRGSRPRRSCSSCTGRQDTAEAIKRLSVRGAPLIGVAAAYGLAMELAREPTPEALERAAALIAGARPTARNLGWAVERVTGRRARRGPAGWPTPPREAASRSTREDEAASAALARHGADALTAVLPDGPVAVMTHCNSGALAASRPRHRPRRDRRARRPPAGDRARLRGPAAAAGRAADRVGVRAGSGSTTSCSSTPPPPA